GSTDSLSTNYGGVCGYQSTTGVGVRGQSTSGYAVYGTTDSVATDHPAIYGYDQQNGAGVEGHSENGTGVYAYCSGTSDCYGAKAIAAGAANRKYGIMATASGGADYNRGVYSYTTSSTNSPDNNYAIYALASNGATASYGVYGRAVGTSTNYGVYGYASGGSTDYAGYFDGDVVVTGALSKGSGSFLIDHPLDPKNEVLRHSFAESPEMLNIYKGNAKTVGKKKTIQMPDWFNALNGKDSSDYSFAVTPLKSFCGGYYVDNSEIASKGRFTVVTEKDCEFSWVVYAVRHDAFALKNPIVVEQSKQDANLGSDCYLSPSAFGAGEEQGCDYQKENQ
ncbi:hypothetical protein H0O03_02805, partial [Candidatus Micrarchaeota archaeon]|nr:hypothetical protein [Candidatus Micrarchaeota archaeon]